MPLLYAKRNGLLLFWPSWVPAQFLAPSNKKEFICFYLSAWPLTVGLPTKDSDLTLGPDSSEKLIKSHEYSENTACISIYIRVYALSQCCLHVFTSSPPHIFCSVGLCFSFSGGWRADSEC